MWFSIVKPVETVPLIATYWSGVWIRRVILPPTDICSCHNSQMYDDCMH